MKTKTIAYVIFSIGTLLAVAAIAGPPVLPPLNPPPPSFETCTATGSGAICRGSRVDTVADVPVGFVCGTADNPIELLLSGTDSFRFTRYYNTAGNFARRFTREDFQGIIFNPVTGLSATVTQNATFTDLFAVPGDLSTSSTQLTGAFLKISLPGSGVLFLDAGRTILDAEGNVISESGHHDFGAYLNGDHSVAEQLCAALGTPGTP